jgi:hypothetical protein
VPRPVCRPSFPPVVVFCTAHGSRRHGHVHRLPCTPSTESTWPKSHRGKSPIHARRRAQQLHAPVLTGPPPPPPMVLAALPVSCCCPSCTARSVAQSFIPPTMKRSSFPSLLLLSQLLYTALSDTVDDRCIKSPVVTFLVCSAMPSSRSPIQVIGRHGAKVPEPLCLCSSAPLLTTKQSPCRHASSASIVAGLSAPLATTSGASTPKLGPYHEGPRRNLHLRYPRSPCHRVCLHIDRLPLTLNRTTSTPPSSPLAISRLPTVPPVS